MWRGIVAQAYPNATVTGFDLDGASFRAAKTTIDASGLGDGVDVNLRDVGHSTSTITSISSSPRPRAGTRGRRC